MNKFKERLRELRNDAQLSQAQLGKLLHCSQDSISNWEIGRSCPNIDMILEIAKYFNVSTDYLLGLED